jgi:tetratricopeptide (TPR) repeat protein
VEPVSPSRLQPNLPLDLATICLKCLQKEPGRRYASALDLAEDLRRFRAGEPILARPVGSAERLWRWGRRNPKVAGLLAALVLVLVSGLGGVTWLWLVAEEHRDRAEAERAIAQRERDEAVTQRRRARAQQAAAQRERAEAERQRARAQANFHKALNLADNLVTRMNDPRLHFVPGQQEQIQRFLKDAVRFYRDILDVEGADPDIRHAIGRAYQWLGNIYMRLGERAQAEETWGLALNVLAKLAAEYPRQQPNYRNALAQSHLMLGTIYRSTNRLGRAEAAFQKARAIRLELIRECPDNDAYRNDLATTHDALGWVFRGTHRPDQARAEFQAALTIREDLAKRYPRATVFAVGRGESCFNLGEILRAYGQPESALDWYAQGIQALESVLNQEPRHSKAGTLLLNTYLARQQALTRLGRHAEALPDWDRAIDLDAGQYGAALRAGRALTLARAGQHARAVRQATALARDRATPGELLPTLAAACSVSSAAVRKDAGLAPAERTKRAEQLAAQAVELLHEAVRKKALGLGQLRKDPDFAPLRLRDDFQRLLADLEKQGEKGAG